MLESPMMSVELRFLLRLLFTYVLGFWFRNGLEPTVRETLIKNLIDTTGLLIDFIAAGVTVYSLIHSTIAAHKSTSATTTEQQISTTEKQSLLKILQAMFDKFRTLMKETLFIKKEIEAVKETPQS